MNTFRNIGRIHRWMRPTIAILAASTSIGFILETTYSNRITEKNIQLKEFKNKQVMGVALSSERPLERSSIVDSVISADFSLKETSGSLFWRRMEVYSAAASVFADYKLCQWRCNQISADTLEGEQKIEDLWNEAHERNAAYLFGKFVSLAALWVKLGQYLSSRADIMPQPFLKHLSKCQDSLPPRDFNDVAKQIEAELGAPLNTIFEVLDPIPIACASIAQVHKARLIGGKEVVVKVQHETVGGRLLQDLKNLETIGDTVRYLDPDFDFSPVIREWAKEVPKELDFREEAKNMKRVQSNLAPLFCSSSPLSIDVSLANVVDEYVTSKILVMEFVDGFKVDDREALDTHEADRDFIVRHVTRSYAHQIFVDGFYSGDPHPGNILIGKSSKRPVLLDFGLTKEVTDDIRFNFAKLIVAANEQDINGLLESLEGVGLRLRPGVTFDAELLAKFFFRDAKPRAVAQEESQKRREDYKKKVELRGKTVYVGDMVDVTSRNLIGFKSVRKAEVKRVFPEDDTLIEVQYTNEELGTVKRSDVKVQASRSPIDAWPDAFIFFERVLGLLRGLTASLDVSQSYFDVMTPYARLALAQHYERAHTSTSKITGSQELLAETAAENEVGGDARADVPTPALPVAAFTVRGTDNSGTGEPIRHLIRELVDSEDVLGCQIHVIRGGKTVVDLCAGVLDPYDRRPVQPDTVFNCFSVTKGVAVTCIHLLVQDGVIDLNSPVATYWPEFAQHGKGNITVAHVLNHQAGLQNAGLEELSKDPFIACDTVRMLQIMAAAEPEDAPGTVTKYHYLSLGWLLEGIVTGATGGQSLREFVRSRIAAPLGLDAELMIGVLPPQHDAAVSSDKLATLVLNRNHMQRMQERMQRQRQGEAVSVSTSDVQAAPASRDETTALAQPVQSVTVTPAAAKPQSTASTAAATDSEISVSSRRRPAENPSLLLNPTFFNNQRIREASIPAANGHFSARSLAQFYHSLLGHSNNQGRDSSTAPASSPLILFGSQADGLGAGGISAHLLASVKSMGHAASVASTGGQEKMLQGDSGKFLLGYMLFPTDDESHTSTPSSSSSSSSAAAVEVVPALGHTGLGGSIAFCDPANNMSVALTVNRLSFDPSNTHRILRQLYVSLNLPVPVAFQTKST